MSLKKFVIRGKHYTLCVFRAEKVESALTDHFFSRNSGAVSMRISLSRPGKFLGPDLSRSEKFGSGTSKCSFLRSGL